jgi:outer membrane lipoprotein-sorting protein
VYDTDSGLREHRIDVTGSATVLGEEAHVVIFTLAPKRESVVWIGKESRRLLQVETMIDANTMLRQVRQP